MNPYDLKVGQLYSLVPNSTASNRLPVAVYDRILNETDVDAKESYVFLYENNVFMYVGEYVNRKFFSDGASIHVFLLDDKYLHMSFRNVLRYFKQAAKKR